MTEDQPHRHWLILVEGGRHFKAGWKDFCDHHHLNVGDFLVFTHHHSYFVFHVSVYDPLTSCQRLFASPSGSTPYSRFNSTNINQTEVSPEIPSVQPQFPTCHITVTYKSHKRSVVYLPRWFITSSGLENRSCFLKLIDKKENPWEVKLLYSKYNGYSYITRGWKNFLISNDIKPKSVVTIQAIQAGKRPIFKVSQVTLPSKSAGCTSEERRDLVQAKDDTIADWIFS